MKSIRLNSEKDLTIECLTARIRKHVKSVCACSSVDRVPGYEPVGRRFESCQARQKKKALVNRELFFVLFMCSV